MTARCQQCRRYVDGLTDSAERHPIFDDLCVRCGNREQRRSWSADDQFVRERNLYPETAR